MTVAMLRLADEIGGQILIDGVSHASMTHEQLRAKLAIIPQEATMFAGALLKAGGSEPRVSWIPRSVSVSSKLACDLAGPLRLNLDPLDQFSDAALHRVLNEVELADVVTRAGGLTAMVAEDGQNWSAGQRQLICIARALLRQSKIVMLDEATASCDVNTDAMVQKVIRRVFADCTVLTIAHRIHTIADSTRIMVLSAGRVVEYDTPDSLMAQDDSIYRSLVEESEKSHEDPEDANVE